MAEAVFGSIVSNVIGGLVSGGGSAGNTASGAAAIYVADQQYKIAKENSDRAQAIHDLTLPRLKDDIQIWQEHARQCLINTVDHDCAEEFETPQYAEMESRAAAAVRLGLGKAKQRLRECADSYCVGATCSQEAQLEVSAGIALADIVTFGRSKEDLRVRMVNQAIRQNRLNSVAIVRGNYQAAQSGMDALARVYAQQAAFAGQAASNSAGAAANLLARVFGRNAPGDFTQTTNPASAGSIYNETTLVPGTGQDATVSIVTGTTTGAATPGYGADTLAGWDGFDPYGASDFTGGSTVEVTPSDTDGWIW